jgi:hypothetical protein
MIKTSLLFNDEEKNNLIASEDFLKIEHSKADTFLERNKG